MRSVLSKVSPASSGGGHLSIVLSEWDTTSPLIYPELTGLRLAPGLEATVEAWRLKDWLDITELRDGLRISSFHHAGTLTVPLSTGSHLSVQIQPKISAQTAATFVLYALGFDRQSIHSLAASAPLQNFGIIDLLAYLFLREVDRIIANGVSQEYQAQSEWLMRPRGRVLFSQLPKRAISSRMALPCRYDLRSSDTPLNRLVQSTLRAFEREIHNRSLRHNLRSRADFFLEMCSGCLFTNEAVRRAEETLDRRTMHYRGAVALSRFLLEGTSPGFTNGETLRCHGYLFSMNVLFEKFVARLCEDYAPAGYEVHAQKSKQEAFSYVQNPYGWQRPALRPDILIRHQGVPHVVLDTKYKLMDRERPSASDLYQLTLYSMSFGHGRPVPARLVYPTENRRPRETCLRFDGLGSRGEKGRVLIAGLPLEPIATALRNPDTGALVREVELLVREDTPAIW